MSALMHMHLRLPLGFLDQLDNLLGDRIGSWYNPILTFAKEDYVALILRKLRYCGQWAAHLAHLSQALV